MINKITIEVPLKDLMQVLAQTGNPEVAAEVLNGTYQEPEFDKSDRASSPDKEGNREQYKFVRYDMWNDEIIYKSVTTWERKTSRLQWNNLELWEDIMDSQKYALAE